MKTKRRFLPFLLSLLLLSGCTEKPSKEEPLPVEPEAPRTESSGPITPTPSPLTEQEQTQRVFVHYQDEIKNYRVEGTDNILLCYRCRTPSLELPGLDKQAGVINNALASLSENFRQGSEENEDGLERLLNDASYFYGERMNDGTADYFTPYAYERDCSTVRGDGTVLSFLFSVYINRGGAHGGTIWSGVSFDPETGNRLLLADLTDDLDSLRGICLDEIRSQCAQMSDMLYDDYSEHIVSLFSNGLWYLNERGLVFIANEYTLAPYAAGTLSFTIRYKALKGILKERFMLPDRSDVQGGIEVSRLLGDSMPDREPLLSLSLDTNGERILFHSINSVYNVRLFTVDYVEANGEFYQREELAYLNHLADGDCFELQTSIPDIIPNIQLSWRLPDGSTQRYLIFQSGKDGSIQLIEPNTTRRLSPGEITEFPFTWDFDGDGNTESIRLTMNGSWQLSVSGEKDALVTLPLSGEIPRLFAADVDEDDHCEIFVEGERTIRCYRYDGDLKKVDFILKGKPVQSLNATVLNLDSDGLHLSCNIPMFNTKIAAQAVFRDGKDGSLALAYGSEWDFFTHEAVTINKELRFTASDGKNSKLPVGAVLTPVSMDDEVLHFITETGVRGTIEVSNLP